MGKPRRGREKAKGTKAAVARKKVGATERQKTAGAMRRPVGQKLTLTKIDAAKAQLKAAVRMYFENQHIAPVFTLANAVREVVGTIGEHLEVETVQKEIAKARGVRVAELVRPISKKAAFFKHADRDPSGKIDLEDDILKTIMSRSRSFSLVTILGASQAVCQSRPKFSKHGYMPLRLSGFWTPLFGGKRS